MSSSLQALAWPIERLGEALALLARHAGLQHHPGEPSGPRQPDELDAWFEAAALSLGCEAAPVAISHRDPGRGLRLFCPGVIRLPGNGTPLFLVVLRVGRRKVALLDTGRSKRTLAVGLLARDLSSDCQAVSDGVEEVLRSSGLSQEQERAVRGRWLQYHHAETQLAEGWALKSSPGAPSLDQAKKARLPQLVLFFLAAYGLKMTAWLVAWWALWKGALRTPPDTGWLIAWALLLASSLPFRLLEPWLGMRFSVAAGSLIKRRLLLGAARIDAEEIRGRGAGSLLGQALECEEAETLSWSAGILIVSHAIDLLLALPILFLGAGGLVHSIFLIAWLLPSAWILRSYCRSRETWARLRLALSEDLTEAMVGHETRLVQADRESWLARDDSALEIYLEASRVMDRRAAIAGVLIPGGWLIGSLLLLAPAIARGNAELASLAAALGISLLMAQSLEFLSKGLSHAFDAKLAWNRASSLLRAAAEHRDRGLPEYAHPGDLDNDPTVTARDLVYRYPTRTRPALDAANLEIARRAHILLDGPSGSGKSTLASILLGHLDPDHGTILLEGLDRSTLGEAGWRNRIAGAPQFHANHVFTGTFAFNLLMGHRWPPSPNDLERALALCRKLGLGDLVERMPGGLQQMVGETGWQLSHGERSRLFLARALLQEANIAVLDESLASLDADTALRVLKLLGEAPSSVVLIAHS